ncbi:uncharacterized protein LOC111083482, partial [Limulus polyphemus]|uniref:Uncharacterized protein LOC111083482 n=1 Tax=Limulus polyphemus TaxID=6850 RepID=A0ABM1RWI6_LIMPO
IIKFKIQVDLPRFIMYPEVLDFGWVIFGETGKMWTRIINKTEASLVWNVSHDGCTCKGQFLVKPYGDLPPGPNQREIEVTFVPNMTGTSSCLLTIEEVALGTRRHLQVTGTATMDEKYMVVVS